MIPEALYWLALGLVAYAYAGYGACVWLLARLRPRPPQPGPGEPSVSLIIPCYNEAAWIATKLDNSLALDYPAARLEILVVSSGSDDGTEAIAARYADRGVRCLDEPVRAGKEAALQAAARLARGEILVFTDANALLNPAALRALTRWFADPTVGCVAGEKRILSDAGGDAHGEGLYWRYESALKRLDSLVGSTMGAAGELLALRANLMTYGPTDHIIEDFVLSMRIVEAGYRVVYEPEATATEAAPPDLAGLFERRARIAAGGLQSIWRLRALLHPHHGLVTWQYLSHRVLRWALVPFLLPPLLLLDLALARRRPLHRLTAAAQLTFYLAATLGWHRRAHPLGHRPYLHLPFFFCTANVAVLAGAYRLLRGQQSVLWKRTRR